jgi:hypothetical protein
MLLWGHQSLYFFKNGAAVIWPNWVTSTSYQVGQYAYNGSTTTNGSNWYQCLVSHTSGTFATDLAGGKWGAVSWITSHAYSINDWIGYNGVAYVCVQAHTSGTLATDIDNGYWEKRTGIPYVVGTPYSATTGTHGGTNYQDLGDVFGIDRALINDVMYIVHPNYAPYKLIRYSDTNWSLTKVEYNVPALLDENITDTKISVTGNLTSQYPSWVNGSTYTPGQLVVYSGFLYVCTNPISPSTVVPPSDGTHWANTGANLPTTQANGPVTLTATAPSWAAGAYYVPGNSVTSGGILYVCNTAHTAGVFATDLGSLYWSVQTVFRSTHVGSTWQLRFNRTKAYVEQQLIANGSSAKLNVRGKFTLTTSGTWNADLNIYASYDNGQTFNIIKTLTSRSDRNWTIDQNEDLNAIYYLNVSNYTTHTGSPDPRAVLSCENQYVNGLVKITGYTSAYVATATTVTPLYVETGSTNPTPTVNWSEAAWSNYQGYPRAITSYQQRLWYAGTSFKPQTVWATVTDDIENFDLGDSTLATDGLRVTLNATGDGRIEWLANQQDLYLGLSGAEWILSAGENNNSAITSTNIFARRQSKFGSASVPATILGDAAIFVGRGGQSIRQMLFSVFQNKYMSSDLVSFSKHVIQTGVQQIAVQNRFKNHTVLWVLSGGQYLSALTYDLEQEVFAWHRHHCFNTYRGQLVPGVFQTANHDRILSVAVVNGADVFSNDEVWCCVQRYNSQGGGTLIKTIERMHPVDFESGGTEESVYPDDAVFLDCCKVINVGLETDPTYQLFWPIKGYSVNAYIVSNGAVVTDSSGAIISQPIQCIENLPVTSSGKVTVTGYTPVIGDTLVIGVPYLSFLKPMRLDVDSRAGYTAALTKSVSEIFVRLLNTGALSVTGNGGNITEFQFKSQNNPFNTPLFTGEKEVNFGNESNTDPQFTLSVKNGMPCTILGIHLKYNIDGTP